MAQELAPTGLIVSGLNIIDHERMWHAESVDSVMVTLSGIPHDRHHSLTRIVQPYESKQLSGMRVMNDRQLSIVDESDMLAISEGMNLSISDIEKRTGLRIARFMAQQLAANVLVSGSVLNNVARHGVLFAFGEDRQDVSAVVRLTEYNEPCRKPSAKMFSTLGSLGLRPECEFDEFKDRFKQCAAEKRGWVASVYRTGEIAIGNEIYTHQPVQVP